MPVFRFDVALRRIGGAAAPDPASTLELIVSELPPPLHAVLAAGSIDDPAESSTDAARERVLRRAVAGALSTDGVTWDVRAVALGHLINQHTGEWIYIPGGTVFEVLKDDSTYEQKLRVAGREVTVAYEIGVRT